MYGRFGHRFGASQAKLGWIFTTLYVIAIVAICVGIVLVQP